MDRGPFDCVKPAGRIHGTRSGGAVPFAGGGLPMICPRRARRAGKRHIVSIDAADADG